MSKEDYSPYNIDDLVLFIFSQYQQHQQNTAKMLRELDKEIRLSNRFFQNSKLVDIIDALSDIACFQVKKGTLLYRCRLIGKEDEHTLFANLFDDVIISWAKQFVPTMDKNSGVDEWIKFMCYFRSHKDELSQQEKVYRQWIEKYSKPSFWGYDKEGSDAPPSGRSLSGRINPDGISYLYAAGDIKTAILEVRPVPTQYVSVAQIEIVEDINLYSFANPIPADTEGKNFFPLIEYDEISKYFAQPNYGGPSYYLATQYISEFIKNKKTSDGQAVFNGLCFRSSLNPEGINYVFFDVSSTKKYRICNSSLYQVNDLLGNATCILPMTTSPSC